MPNAAQAYIDPAATSYLIQVVSGVVITLSVTVGVFFRRIMMGLATLEAHLAAEWSVLVSPDRRELWDQRRQARARPRTAKKPSQSPASRVETPSAAAARLEAERLAAAGEELSSPAFGTPGPVVPEGTGPDPADIALACVGLVASPQESSAQGGLGGTGGETSISPNPEHPDLAVSKWQFIWHDSRPARRRFAIALPAGFAGPFLLFGFGFMDLYLQEPGEFPFTFGQVAIPALGLTLAAGTGVVAALICLRGRVFDLAVSFVLGLTLAAWIQGNFLNLYYGELNGAAIQWQDWDTEAAANTVIWMALAVLPLLIRVLSRSIWSVAAWLGPATLIVAGSIGLATTPATHGVPPWEAASADLPTFQGAFTVSATANQYIFVLDMMDQEYVREIEDTDPDFFASQLDGFTQFDNHISNYNRTLPSAVDMLTGEPYQFDEPIGQYMARAYKNGTFLPALRDAGYSTNIYATNLYSYSKISDIRGLADNVQPAEFQTSSATIIRGMAELSAFRYGPHISKPTFWAPEGPFAEAKAEFLPGDPFRNSNFEFYGRLHASGLKMGQSQPRFSYFHLDGAHSPAVMNSQVERVPKFSVPLVEQARGAFKIVFDYIDELKRLGVYEDASIVITADHGYWGEAAVTGVAEPHLTALFVKPAGSAGTPLMHSDAPTQMTNVRATLLADAGVRDPDGAPTVFEVPLSSTAPRDYFCRRGNTVDEGKIDHWQVTGDARVWANWHFIGQTRTAYWG
jgi:hypothetical protein